MERAALDQLESPDREHMQGREPAPLPPTHPGALLVELSKPGIVKMVTFSAAVGYVMAALGSNEWLTHGLLWGPAWWSMLGCVVGTALSAAGANALNQVMEAERDARMARTARRPLPSGRMGPASAAGAGVLAGVLGLGILCVACNAWSSLVSGLTILTYLACYTPLKPITSLATIIGAVPGALPPLIGWAAASQVGARSEAMSPGYAFAGLLQPGGWSIFAVMFAWQVPHFLAIAWKYREQYAAAGHKVLPSFDPSGARTGRSAVAWSLALVPVSLAPILAMPGRLGVGYCLCAMVAGCGMCAASVRLARERSNGAARSLFIVSILYLPVVLTAMMIDAGAHAWLGAR